MPDWLPGPGDPEGGKVIVVVGGLFIMVLSKCVTSD